MICTDEANLIAFDVIGCDAELFAASAAVHPSEVPACLFEDPMRAGMASADAPFGDAPCTDFGDEADVLNSLTPADLALIEPFMADECDEEVQEPGEVSNGDAISEEELDALAAVIGLEAEEPLGVVGFVSYECAPNRSFANCFVCGSKTKAGIWRFNYRYKNSSSLRRQKRIHSHCAARAPEATRSHDIRIVQQ